jgi:hypothetical protein
VVGVAVAVAVAVVAGAEGVAAGRLGVVTRGTDAPELPDGALGVTTGDDDGFTSGVPSVATRAASFM